MGTPLRGAEDARELDGTPVGVARVYYSVDTPHVVDGLTYLRVHCSTTLRSLTGAYDSAGLRNCTSCAWAIGGSTPTRRAPC